ncbi:hypothetical protein [Cellulosimicrobium marinum]|uniref:hypothetical protein n=1 Tax=Cellulosimicrobium marinum TaxID=1638992 RepID=UPI001E5F70EC|nr:hypothetical protein [Cellulosimicrobium marinum]MCB7137659.1 hypothetical protein [Cellulosimicrobium marinum]
MGYARLDVDDQDPVGSYVADCVESLRRVAPLFDVAGALPDLERLAAAEPGLGYADLAGVTARTGTDFTTDVVAALVAVHLETWSEGGADGLCLAPLYDRGRAPAGDAGARELLDRWVRASADVALLARRTPGVEVRAAGALGHLARGLVAADREAAVACALDAIMLASLVADGAPTVDAAATLFDVANGHDEDLARLALAYRAGGLSRLPGPRRDDLALWDAVESACRYRPEAPTPHLAAAQELLAVLDRVPAVRDLSGTFALAFDHDPDRAEAFAPLRAFSEPVWECGVAELGERVHALRGVSTVFDERRLALVPPPEHAVATADIDDWSVDHHAFRHAVPFSTGFRREAERREMLLVLGHELIHIDSTFGWLGTSFVALRTAATADEVAHHTRGLGSASPEPDALGRLAALEPVGVLLPLVERQLELVRKAQVLRAVWTPWLEGLAMFGELAADPTTDDERTTSFGGPLAHLVDHHHDPATDPPVREWWAARHAEAESGYADALAELGPFRLRAYLGRPPGRYLAGYLAVRGVLSAWRAHRPLGGVDAYQCLLGATRSTTRHAVPDLALAPEEFTERSLALMSTWVVRAAASDGPALDALDPYRARTPRDVMTGGPAQPPSTDDCALLARAAGVPRADRSPEVADLEPGSRAALTRLFDVVAERVPAHDLEVLSEIALARAHRMQLVPIGRFDAMFWLWSDPESTSASLLLQLRVTSDLGSDDHDEAPGDTGGYSLYGVPLDADEQSRLRAEMDTRRRARMEVHRFADRAGSRENGLTGGQYLALRYGGFVKVMSGGLASGIAPAASVVDAVRTRLVPSPLTLLDLRVNDAPTLARRALAWLDTIDASVSSLPALGAWRDRVRALARQVAEPDEAALVARAGHALLGRLGWTADEVAAVTADGLGALADDDTTGLGPVLAALLASGRDGPLEETPGVDPGILARLFHRTTAGVDARPIPEETA